MKNYSLIIWDFNGTLLDDVGAALASVNDMLKRRNRENINLDEYKEQIDVPIRKFYEHFFDLKKENYDAMLPEYQRGYEEHLKDCTLTKYVIQTLEKAKTLNIPQIVLSSSQHSQLERLIKKYGIFSYFDEILGADNLLAESKLQRAVDYIKINNIDSKSALVIGDLIHDYEVAQALSAKCLLLTSGHQDKKRLEITGARVEDDLRSLINE